MSHAAADTHVHHHDEEHDDHGHMEIVEHGVHIPHSSKKEIWKIFFILSAITALEFLVALVPVFKEKLGKEFVVGTFFVLTIFKAYFIVGNFMHLKHEKMNMAYTILVPLLFIVYLIILIIIEGNFQIFGWNWKF